MSCSPTALTTQALASRIWQWWARSSRSGSSEPLLLSDPTPRAENEPRHPLFRKPRRGADLSVGSGQAGSADALAGAGGDSWGQKQGGRLHTGTVENRENAQDDSPGPVQRWGVQRVDEDGIGKGFLSDTREV